MRLPGFSCLDDQDGDIVAVRRDDGTFLAAFSARGATKDGFVDRLAFVPATHPLPADRSPAAHLVGHAASAARGSLLQQGDAVAEGEGSEARENDKCKERKYCHETPSRSGRDVITNATSAGKNVLFAAQPVGGGGS